MRGWTSGRWPWTAALWLSLAWWLAASPARAEGIEAIGLQVERGDSGWVLSTTLRFDLPSNVEDALLKGVPMVFVAEAEVLRDRWYWTDKQVAAVARHMRLAFQPLTRKWRLNVSAEPFGASGPGTSFSQSFDSLPEALSTIQRFSRWKVAELADIEPDGRHNLIFRFRLDLSQLPRPFQIGAVGHSEWTIALTRNLRLPTGGSR